MKPSILQRATDHAVQDLCLLSRRAWITAVASNQQQRRQRPPQHSQRRRMGKSVPVGSPSIEKGVKKSQSMATLKTLPIVSPYVKSTHISIMQEIEKMAEYVNQQVPQSIRATRLATIPQTVAKIDKDLLQQQHVRPNQHVPKHRPSARLLRQHKIDQGRWNKLIRKELRSTMREHFDAHQVIQRKWVCIVQGIVSSLNVWKRKWDTILHHRKVEKERNYAIAKLQGGWRKSYSTKMDAKHERTYELLRRRAWIARLNVRTRQRAKHATIVRRFLNLYSNQGRFAQAMKLYRWRVIRCQRATRQWFLIRNARLRALTKLWKIFEPEVLIELEISELKRERQHEHQQKIRRMSEQMGVDAAVLMQQITMNATNETPPEPKDVSRTLQKKQTTSIPKPSNVRWEISKKRQLKIQTRTEWLISLLEKREQLITEDQQLQIHRKQTQRWGSVKKKAKVLLPREITLPGLRILSGVSGMKRIRGPLEASTILIKKNEQQEEMKKKRRLKQKQQQEEEFQRRRRNAGRRKSKVTSNVISRFEPLDEMTRRRVILDWMSSCLRETWSLHEEREQHINNSCKVISVEEMKQIMADGDKEEHSTVLDRSDLLLKQALTAKPLPPFLFPLFSEYALEIKKVIKISHEKKRDIVKLRQSQQEMKSHEILNTCSNHERINSTNHVNSTSTLRNLLGDDLIETISGFVQTPPNKNSVHNARRASVG